MNQIFIEDYKISQVEGAQNAVVWPLTQRVLVWMLRKCVFSFFGAENNYYCKSKLNSAVLVYTVAVLGQCKDKNKVSYP